MSFIFPPYQMGLIFVVAIFTITRRARATIRTMASMFTIFTDHVQVTILLDPLWP